MKKGETFSRCLERNQETMIKFNLYAWVRRRKHYLTIIRQCIGHSCGVSPPNKFLSKCLIFCANYKRLSRESGLKTAGEKGKKLHSLGKEIHPLKMASKRTRLKGRVRNVTAEVVYQQEVQHDVRMADKR